MRIKVNAKEIENVLKQNGAIRYKYFINKVVDTEKVWGLYNEGWALAGDEEGNTIIPLWPLREFAELCKTGEWNNFIPTSLEVHEFLEEFLPCLKENQILPGVFYNAEDKGVVPSHNQLSDDLRAQLARVE